MLNEPEGCTVPYSSVTAKVPLLRLTPDWLSVTVPETTTETSLPLGGQSEDGFAVAVMAGGVVSPEITSKVCTELLVTVGCVALVAMRVMTSAVPMVADCGAKR